MWQRFYKWVLMFLNPETKRTAISADKDQKDAIDPDPRPDPEDPDAYAFVDKVLNEFSVSKMHYQILKGGGQPSDVTIKAPPALISAAPPGWAWWIDVYDGPRGRGYQICFEILKAGRTFRKVVNDGPEKWRELDWTEQSVSMSP